MYKMTNIVMVRKDCFVFLSKKILGQLVECFKFTLHENICPSWIPGVRKYIADKAFKDFKGKNSSRK